MSKLLSIETGFTCNSRCKYCTQLDYRVIPQADKLDLDTAQIIERIRFGAANGYDQIGFSGGEPTIRPDFVDLIKEARSHPFKRIGVTTNGRMFAYRKFAEEVMLAGLDGFTFSLHGHTSELHDKITASPGALEQAMTGLRNVAHVKRKHGLQAHLMNNQILLPDNTHYIKEVVETMAPFGVGLFMIQPFITQRSNSDDLGKFYVPYDDIVAAVERAIPALEKFGARVKPYNVPNCLLWRFGERYVEPQFYGLRSFREYEAKNPGEFKAFKAKQWYRIPECKTCKEYCPGFRIEQYPQTKMAGGLVDAADGFAASVSEKPAIATESAPSPANKPLLFSGTELFDESTIRAAFAELSATHGPVAWMTALCEKVPRKRQSHLIADLFEQGHLAELVLITQPLDQRFLAQRVLEKGNIEEVRAGLYMLAERLKEGRKLPKIRVLFNVGDIARLLTDKMVSHQWPLLVRSLAGASGKGTDDHQMPDAIIAISNFPRDSKPPDMQRQRDRNIALAKQIKAACEVAGMRPLLASLDDQRGLDPPRAKEMATVEAQFAEVLSVESWATRLFRHPFSMPEMDFVSWSPPWLFERWDLSKGATPENAVAQTQDTSGSGIRTSSVASVAK
jgi:molybdenum cofactor biosynthesis enzyme MoaA